MRKREFWLKLFSENDTALAAAVHLVQRFVTEQSLATGQDFLLQKRQELYEPMDPRKVAITFPELAEAPTATTR